MHIESGCGRVPAGLAALNTWLGERASGLHNAASMGMATLSSASVWWLALGT